LSRKGDSGQVIKTIALIVVALVVCFALAAIYGSFRWQSDTDTLRARLDEGRRPVTPEAYDARGLAGLPVPVQRYFRAVLTDGQPLIASANVVQAGQFNMGETSDHWKDFTATQRVVTGRPGFDWDARIRVAPGVNVCVHDAYVAGEGILHAAQFGLVTVANMRGTPEAAEGELMRFLAEAVWYPTAALLPSQGVSWEAVDNASAKATLRDGGATVTLLFRFNDAGLINSVHADARGRTVNGAVVPTPWEGRMWHYEVRDGLHIPLEAEVAWLLPEGRKPYWRGRITAIGYEFAY
jgi:hypothetical protein